MAENTTVNAHRSATKPQNRRRAKRYGKSRHGGTEASDIVHLYGLHTVRAALDNPARKIVALKATQNALNRLNADGMAPITATIEPSTTGELSRLVGRDAVHQGVVAIARPLAPVLLADLVETELVVILDQITDPHNVGAIMRTAVAMGCGGLVSTWRHAPGETGVLAKSASGALDRLRVTHVTNLSKAIGELREIGFYAIGLDSEAPELLEKIVTPGPLALVFGAEGKGLRPKVRGNCDALARIDLPGTIISLNVSNAAAIALYVAQRRANITASE